MKGDRIVVEVEIPGFYADDIRENAEDMADFMDESEYITDLMHLNSEEVVVVFVLAPGEKGQNDEKELISMQGRIVGAKLAVAPTGGHGE